MDMHHECILAAYGGQVEGCDESDNANVWQEAEGVKGIEHGGNGNESRLSGEGDNDANGSASQEGRNGGREGSNCVDRRRRRRAVKACTVCGNAAKWKCEGNCIVLARYCSKKCQKRDWMAHKWICQ